jgi:hypothetical protein
MPNVGNGDEWISIWRLFAGNEFWAPSTEEEESKNRRGNAAYQFRIFDHLDGLLKSKLDSSLRSASVLCRMPRMWRSCRRGRIDWERLFHVNFIEDLHWADDLSAADEWLEITVPNHA